MKVFFRQYSFGKNVPQDSSPVIGRVSEFTDVMSGLVVSSSLLPMGLREEAIAEGQLKLFTEKMKSWYQDQLLFVYDRGYPSKQFILSHVEQKVDFVFRILNGFNQQIDAFVASGAPDGMLKLYDEALNLRILVFELTSGAREILLTSLLNEVEVTYEELFAIYGARWRAMEEGQATENTV
jgi:hypothetical protein